MQCLLIFITDILIRNKHIDEANEFTKAMFEVNFLCSLVMRIWSESDGTHTMEIM